jgi:hypothetical protein
LHESIGHYSMMLRRMEDKGMRALSETPEQDERGRTVHYLLQKPRPRLKLR